VTALSRQEAFSGTKEVPEKLAFDTGALEAYLQPRVPGFAGPVAARQFKGGQSNPTYLITTPGRAYVLRRKPPGKLLASAHAVDREYRVLTALHGQGFPVAEPLVLCEDDTVIGTAFYVMSHVEGRVLWDPGLPDCVPSERRPIYDAMNDTIARLHAFDPAAIGLADFGKAEGYVARQVRRWSEQYRLSETQEIPEMNRLMAWLPDHVPPTSRAALVHGDYRLDNLILHPSEPRVAAVLDWELATLGDPNADFVYHLMTWVMPRSDTGGGTGTLLGRDLAALGIPAWRITRRNMRAAWALARSRISKRSCPTTSSASPRFCRASRGACATGRRRTPTPPPWPRRFARWRWPPGIGRSGRERAEPHSRRSAEGRRSLAPLAEEGAEQRRRLALADAAINLGRVVAGGCWKKRTPCSTAPPLGSGAPK
jgi:aminoglycoside phosphotransferase (APT) family kinase protein